MKVLIVEDETLVACGLEMLFEDLGRQPVGIATDAAQALDLASAGPEIAFVDVNLRDGPTGPTIGARLAQNGVKVVFLTANPSQLGAGAPGAVGILTKPYA